MDAKLYTTADVAASRGCHPASVARVAKSQQIGRRAGRDWIFTADEADRLGKMIRDGVGNPNFGKEPKKIRRKKTR